MSDLIERLKHELTPDRREEILSKGWDVAVRGLLEEVRSGKGIGDHHRLVAESWMMEGKDELIEEAVKALEARDKTISELREELLKSEYRADSFYRANMDMDRLLSQAQSKDKAE